MKILEEIELHPLGIWHDYINAWATIGVWHGNYRMGVYDIKRFCELLDEPVLTYGDYMRERWPGIADTILSKASPEALKNIDRLVDSP